MNTERLGSIAEFASRLAAHLASFVEATLPVPDEAQLRTLLEAAFFASLYEEEARRLEFGIAWQPDLNACAAVISMSPLRVTPANLAKLAPATLSEGTSIAVHVAAGGDLVAWALLERSAVARQPLTIRVLTPGVLRVDYAGVARALYARGESLFHGGAHRVKSPAQRLTRTFAAWAANAERAAVITSLAARSLAHRHGGMILIAPAASWPPAGVRIHYAVDDGANLLVERVTDGATSAERLELVARLTAIDNALLLDTDLCVRGFGAQVIESDVPRTEFLHTSPYSDEAHTDDLTTFKGTRHPAGVIFCMRQAGAAAAIIASQDGNLSLAVKDASGTVEVLGSYVHAFGWTEGGTYATGSGSSR